MIAARGGRAVAVPGDVTHPEDAERLVARTIEVFGRIDAMVCSAGIGYHGTLDDTPADVMQRVVNVNLLGTLYAARAAIAAFRRQGHGHLIVISSIVGRRGVAGAAVYGATKAAQVGLVESLRAEFTGTNIRASVILPVSTDTEFREAQKRDYGRLVEGHGPLQAASVVAERIATCLDAPAPEAYTLRRARLLAILNALAPGWTDRIVQRYGRRVVTPDPHA